MKINKFLLVMFAPYRTVQLQIAALSAYLKRLGCDVRYLEIVLSVGQSFDSCKELVKKEIQEHRPDMVGFSSYDLNQAYILSCADYIKTLSGARIIVGGQNASLVPQEFITHKTIDYVCIGEGERVLRELLGALERDESVARIPGLCSKDAAGKITYNPAGPLITHLDELPFYDRTIVNSQQKSLSYLPMTVGRGCPYRCTYCSDESMKNLHPNKNEYVRYRSPERVIEEIKQCVEMHDFDYIYFYDDIFAINYEWLLKFCELYKANFPALPFRCLLRPEIASKEKFIKILAEMGCNSIAMGVESGAEDFRKRVLARSGSNQTILNAAAMIKKYGMDLTIFLIVGFPGETIPQMIKTVLLNLRIRANTANTLIFMPLKGTPLYKYCVENNMINEERRKEMLVMTHGSCLNYGILKRSLLVLFRYVNSAIPVLCHFRLSYISLFFEIQYNRIFRKEITSDILDMVAKKRKEGALPASAAVKRDLCLKNSS